MPFGVAEERESPNNIWLEKFQNCLHRAARNELNVADVLSGVSLHYVLAIEFKNPLSRGEWKASRKVVRA